MPLKIVLAVTLLMVSGAASPANVTIVVADPAV